MVEIFKTNVNNKLLAKKIVKGLGECMPGHCFNFDLDDCDRILRAQSQGCPVEITTIISFVSGHRVEISLFEE
jgi:hypothetical protein